MTSCAAAATIWKPISRHTRRSKAIHLHRTNRLPCPLSLDALGRRTLRSDVRFLRRLRTPARTGRIRRRRRSNARQRRSWRPHPRRHRRRTDAARSRDRSKPQPHDRPPGCQGWDPDVAEAVNAIRNKRSFRQLDIIRLA